MVSERNENSNHVEFSLAKLENHFAYLENSTTVRELGAILRCSYKFKLVNKTSSKTMQQSESKEMKIKTNQ